MCNCDSYKCAHPDCNRYIPMHLADFSMQPCEITVWCGKHKPKHDVVVERITETDSFEWPLRKGSSMAIRFKIPLPEGYKYEDYQMNIVSHSELEVVGNPIQPDKLICKEPDDPMRWFACTQFCDRSYRKYPQRGRK